MICSIVSPSPLSFSSSGLRGGYYRHQFAIIMVCFLEQRDGVFFISGDVHFGEITRYDCGAGYPLYDITSSGLTQAIEKVLPSPLHFIVRFLAWFTPSTMRAMSQTCRYRSCTYGMFVICLFSNYWMLTLD